MKPQQPTASESKGCCPGGVSVQLALSGGGQYEAHQVHEPPNITVVDGRVAYRTLRGTRTLELQDVAGSEFDLSLASRDQPMLIVRSARGADSLRINLKPFRRDDIGRLLAHPGLKLAKGDDVA